MTTIAQMTFPKQPCTRPFRIVLTDLGENASMRYATHWQATDEDRPKFYGHYFAVLSEAMRDFLDRCERPLKYEEAITAKATEEDWPELANG